MDINNPTNSRFLAVLIQNVPFERRQEFLEAAQEADSLEEFVQEYPNFIEE